jgi:carbamoyl-phosphate synthase large subunit
VPVQDVVAKVGEGPNTALDRIGNGEIDLVVNTPRGLGARADGAYIRTAANVHNVPCLTTVAAALAAAAGIADWAEHGLSVRSLQEYHEGEQLRLPV